MNKPDSSLPRLRTPSRYPVAECHRDWAWRMFIRAVTYSQARLALALVQQVRTPARWSIIRSMVIAICSIIAAVVSVLGTLTATVVTQRSALNNKRLELEAHQTEAREQRQTDAADRDAAEQRRALAEKTSLYAALNSAARSYRSACMDLTNSLVPDEERTVALLNRESLDRLENARLNYLDLYARAQMIVADGTLDVASEVNRCLVHPDTAVRRWVGLLLANPDAARQASSIRSLATIGEFLEGPGAVAIWTLRRALRTELGVSEGSHDFSAAIAELAAARRQVGMIQPGMETANGTPSAA